MSKCLVSSLAGLKAIDFFRHLQHWPESCVDYVKNFGLTATFFRGCRTYTKRKVLYAQDQANVKVPGKLHTNQLPLPFTDVQRDVTAVLQSWRVTERKKTSAFSGTLWMAQDLSAHLNLPGSSPCPAGVVQQVFFKEVGLPAFLITLCESDLDREAEDKIHRYAVELLKHHSRTMKDYCSHPFVILPLTIKSKNLSSEGVEKGIQAEVKKARCYKGPFDISQSAYDSLKKGMEAVSAGTMMPCFLNDSDAESEWSLQLPEEWRELLHIFIEFMRQERGHDKHTCYHQTFQAVRIAFLEAVRRISLTERVDVYTDDHTIKTCIEKSAEHTRKNQGRQENLVNSDSSAGEKSVSITVSQDAITFQRHFQAQTKLSEEEDSDSQKEEGSPVFLKISNNKQPIHSPSDYENETFKRQLQKTRKRIELALLTNSVHGAARIEDPFSGTIGDEQDLLMSRLHQKPTLLRLWDELKIEIHTATKKKDLFDSTTVAEEKSPPNQKPAWTDLNNQQANKTHMAPKMQDTLNKTVAVEEARSLKQNSRRLLSDGEQEISGYIAGKQSVAGYSYLVPHFQTVFWQDLKQGEEDIILRMMELHTQTEQIQPHLSKRVDTADTPQQRTAVNKRRPQTARRCAVSLSKITLEVPIARSVHRDYQQPKHWQSTCLKA